MAYGSLIKLARIPVVLTSTLLALTNDLPMPLTEETGIASIYAYTGELTANGEWALPWALTAAHRTLPFGTLVRVIDDISDRAVVVRINDRGPFIDGRIIDLTPAGAAALGFDGLTHVTLEVLGKAS